MSIEPWLAFVAASAVLLIIPGPTILTVISYSVAHGRRANVPLVAAVALAPLNAALYAAFAGSARGCWRPRGRKGDSTSRAARSCGPRGCGSCWRARRETGSLQRPAKLAPGAALQSADHLPVAQLDRAPAF
jgi:hypothetical protein